MLPSTLGTIGFDRDVPASRCVAPFITRPYKCDKGKGLAGTRPTASLPRVWDRKVLSRVAPLKGCTPLYHPHPCGNFSGTSSLKFRGTKGSIGHTFMVCIHTENQNQGDFYPFVLLEISVLHESPLGHLRYGLTDVPPQPNSPPDNVFNPDQPAKDLNARSWALTPSSALLNK